MPSKRIGRPNRCDKIATMGMPSDAPIIQYANTRGADKTLYENARKALKIDD